jgi:hypothetical protein
MNVELLGKKVQRDTLLKNWSPIVRARAERVWRRIMVGMEG